MKNLNRFVEGTPRGSDTTRLLIRRLRPPPLLWRPKARLTQLKGHGRPEFPALTLANTTRIPTEKDAHNG